MLTKRQLLAHLSKDQLLGVASLHDIAVPRSTKNDELIDILSRKHAVQPESFLVRDLFNRDDLKKLCRKLDLDDSGKDIQSIIDRIVEASAQPKQPTKVMVLRQKAHISQSFMYFFLTSPQTREILQMLAESRSGTFPQITFDQLRGLEINLHSDELIASASVLCDSWLNKLCANHSQIKLLENIRNDLLPKLMSGEAIVEAGLK